MTTKQMIGIDEVTKFIEREFPDLKGSALKMRSRQFYVTLFRAALNGQLDLIFVCRKCLRDMGLCRCNGEVFQDKWVHHQKPQELSEQWMLRSASVRNLGKVQVYSFGKQTTERVERFIAFVRAGCK